MKHALKKLAVVALLAARVALPDHAYAADKDIVQTAVAAGQFKTLAAALDAAGLTATLEGPGPFTVFAPTDDAFAKLPAGTVQNLLKPENKAELDKVLTYHVVPGRITSKELIHKIKAGGGKAELKTVEGGMLTATLEDGKVVLTDEKGDKATVTIADVYQKNGVIHVINTVLLPN